MMTGVVSAWIERRIEAYPSWADDEPVLVEGSRAMARIADDEDAEPEDRIEARRTVEHVVDQYMSDPRPEVGTGYLWWYRLSDGSRENLLAAWDFQAEHGFATVTRAELLDELDRLDHECAEAWPRVLRMLLAALGSDADALGIVSRELSCCAECWKAATLHLVAAVATDPALKARGIENAVRAVESELLHEIRCAATREDER